MTSKPSKVLWQLKQWTVSSSKDLDTVMCFLSPSFPSSSMQAFPLDSSMGWGRCHSSLWVLDAIPIVHWAPKTHRVLDLRVWTLMCTPLTMVQSRLLLHWRSFQILDLNPQPRSPSHRSPLVSTNDINLDGSCHPRWHGHLSWYPKVGTTITGGFRVIEQLSEAVCPCSIRLYIFTFSGPRNNHPFQNETWLFVKSSNIGFAYRFIIFIEYCAIYWKQYHDRMHLYFWSQFSSEFWMIILRNSSFDIIFHKLIK